MQIVDHIKLVGHMLFVGYKQHTGHMQLAGRNFFMTALRLKSEFAFLTPLNADIFTGNVMFKWNTANLKSELSFAYIGVTYP